MIQIRRLKSPRRRFELSRYTFVAPQFILYFALTILPFVVAFPILFTNMSSYTDQTATYVGFANFTAIFTNPSLGSAFFDALRKTVVFTTLNYLNIYIFGLALALLMYEIGFQGWFFIIVYLPMMLSGVALGYVAKALFAYGNGTGNLILVQLGLPQVDIANPSTTPIILALLVGWRYAGFNMAIFLAGLLSIPKETIEASVVDGASYWQRLFRVYFPQMIPSFIMASTLLIIGSFGVFDELIALSGHTVNIGARFSSVLFYVTAFNSNQLALGMTMAVETFVPLVIVGIALLELQRRLRA